MRKHDWPNGLGFDIRTHAGEWEILTPATAAQPFRARFIPHGERFPSLYGEGSTAEAAMMGAEQVWGQGAAQDEPEACPGCGCLPGDGRTAGCTDPDGCGYFAPRQCYACERFATDPADEAAYVAGTVDVSSPESGPRPGAFAEVVYCAACAPRRAEAPCPACGGIGMGHTCCPPPAAS